MRNIAKSHPLVAASIALTLLVLPRSSPVTAADDYVLGPESVERAADVPVGKVADFEFSASKIFPDTQRTGSIYIPAQYDASKPAALMVFQDGRAYASTSGQVRVPVVFDNLIAKGEMPVTIGVFVDPGSRGVDGPPAAARGNRSNRSFEYDSLGPAYVRFLDEELLPFVEEKFSDSISKDPRHRAICGMSSGGIAAFTAAWERPSSFSKVVSHIGSFTNIRGGHVYPALIRKTERKPIRVFLQDGSNDLNNLHGNWPLANQEMASSLAFAGYDFRFEFGDGAHSAKHGGAIFPDTLRWLWRPELEALPKPITKDNLGGDEALSKVLVDGGSPGDWELVSEGHAFTDGAASNAEGDFFFSDLPRGRIYRVPASGGAPEVWLDGGPRVSGMKFGADGKLYAATQGQLEPEAEKDAKRIVVIDPRTKAIETVALEVQPNDLVVSRLGYVYFTDTGAGTVVRVPTNARDLPRPAAVAGGINRPNGIATSPDGHLLIVSEHGGIHAWTFLLAEDGSLKGGERNIELRTPVDRDRSGGDGMIADVKSRYFITSDVGIQMFDANGRMGGVLSKPQDKGTVSCAFAGADRSYLYVCSSDRIYRRKTLTQGSVPAP
jgi:gluconolactonase